MSRLRLSVIVIFILLLLGSGAYVFAPHEETAAVGMPLGEAVYVTRTGEGYVPREITINKGDVVIWQNESGQFHWPASDIHPTHSIYSDFDPRRPVADDEEWSFQFLKAGTWKYHDHLRANLTGMITVTE